MTDSMRPLDGGESAGPARKARAAYRLDGGAPPAGDSVRISPEVMRLRGVEGVRFAKVMAVRAALDAGTCLTPETLDAALDRALDGMLAD